MTTPRLSSAIPEISRHLLEHGVSADLPVAIVENGTTGKQRTILGSLRTMRLDAQRAAIRSPAMIYIGEAVKEAERLQWFSGQSVAEEFLDWSDTAALQAS